MFCTVEFFLCIFHPSAIATVTNQRYGLWYLRTRDHKSTKNCDRRLASSTQVWHHGRWVSPSPTGFQHGRPHSQLLVNRSRACAAPSPSSAENADTSDETEWRNTQRELKRERGKWIRFLIIAYLQRSSFTLYLKILMTFRYSQPVMLILSLNDVIIFLFLNNALPEWGFNEKMLNGIQI